MWGFSGDFLPTIITFYYHLFVHIMENYRKFPKYSDTEKVVVITLKLTMWLYRRVMSPNDADGLGNSVDPDQWSSLGAV